MINKMTGWIMKKWLNNDQVKKDPWVACVCCTLYTDKSFSVVCLVSPNTDWEPQISTGCVLNLLIFIIILLTPCNLLVLHTFINLMDLWDYISFYPLDMYSSHQYFIDNKTNSCRYDCLKLDCKKAGY